MEPDPIIKVRDRAYELADTGNYGFWGDISERCAREGAAACDAPHEQEEQQKRLGQLVRFWRRPDLSAFSLIVHDERILRVMPSHAVVCDLSGGS